MTSLGPDYCTLDSDVANSNDKCKFFDNESVAASESTIQDKVTAYPSPTYVILGGGFIVTNKTITLAF